MNNGYQLVAIASNGQATATYYEANSPARALEVCIREFPADEGWTGHYAQCCETQAVTKVVDTKPLGLPLDPDETTTYGMRVGPGDVVADLVYDYDLDVSPGVGEWLSERMDKMFEKPKALALEDDDFKPGALSLEDFD